MRLNASICECAGIIGIDPKPFTLRELQKMRNAAMMIKWDHTAAVCATVINMHRDPKKGNPADPVKMNPYRVQKTHKIKRSPQESMEMLKKVFIKK